MDLQLELGGHFFEFQLTSGRLLNLAHPLQADVVAASLEDRPGERLEEMIGQKREILGGQLILQCLGCGRNHHSFTRENRWHEITHRLAGSGASRDHEVTTGRQRMCYSFGHLLLARPILGGW